MDDSEEENQTSTATTTTTTSITTSPNTVLTTNDVKLTCDIHSSCADCVRNSSLKPFKMFGCEKHVRCIDCWHIICEKLFK